MPSSDPPTPSGAMDTFSKGIANADGLMKRHPNVFQYGASRRGGSCHRRVCPRRRIRAAVLCGAYYAGSRRGSIVSIMEEGLFFGKNCDLCGLR